MLGAVISTINLIRKIRLSLDQPEFVLLGYHQIKSSIEMLG